MYISLSYIQNFSSGIVVSNFRPSKRVRSMDECFTAFIITRWICRQRKFSSFERATRRWLHYIGALSPVLVKLPELSDNEVNLFTRLPRLWSCKHVRCIYRSITWYRDLCRDTFARVYILWMWASVCIVMSTQYRKTTVKDGFWDSRLWLTIVSWLSTLRSISTLESNCLLD